MIQHNNHQIDAKDVVTTTAKVLENLITKGLSKSSKATYKKSLERANSVYKCLTSEKNAFDADKEDHFKKSANERSLKPFAATTFIQGVPSHSTLEIKKALSGCTDFAKKSSQCATMIKMINGMIGANTPKKLLNFG